MIYMCFCEEKCVCKSQVRLSNVSMQCYFYVKLVQRGWCERNAKCDEHIIDESQEFCDGRWKS